jgi:hypothetical protein
MCIKLNVNGTVILMRCTLQYYQNMFYDMDNYQRKVRIKWNIRNISWYVILIIQSKHLQLHETKISETPFIKHTTIFTQFLKIMACSHWFINKYREVQSLIMAFHFAQSFSQPAVSRPWQNCWNKQCVPLCNFIVKKTIHFH